MKSPERFQATYGEPLKLGDSIRLRRDEKMVSFKVVVITKEILHIWYTFQEEPE